MRIVGISILSALALMAAITSSCLRNKMVQEAVSGPGRDSVFLSESQIQLAGIKFAEVRRSIIHQTVLLNGILKSDEMTTASITARTNGRIEKVFVKLPGERVTKGDSLYTIYSDELVAAEKEFFTLESSNWNFNRKYEPSLELENKLLYLGMTGDQIELLRKNGKPMFVVTVVSGASGVVRAVNIVEGSYVQQGDRLYEIADDKELWAEAQGYQRDLPFLEPGMKAKITFAGMPGEASLSKVSAISPALAAGSNYAVVRAAVQNREANLYAGMAVTIEVETAGIMTVSVPNSALVTGQGGSRAWVREADGTFTPRNVETGIATRDSTEILSGLYEYDNVVISGAYLLDSELTLRQGIR